MFRWHYFVFAIFIGISEVNANLLLPVDNNVDIPLNLENLTSHSCKNDITLWIESLRNNTLWAYRMWDATAKYPIGLTEGNAYQLGNFDECLSIEHPFTAQYCLTTIEYTIVLNTTIKDPFSLEYDPYESVYKKIYHSGYRNRIKRDVVHWGLCVPASCTTHEIQNALQAHLDKQINPNIKKYLVKLEQADCQTTSSIDASNNILDSSFSKIIIGCMIFVTFCTVIDQRYYSNINVKNAKKSRVTELLMCFSAKQSYKVLTQPEKLPALHGVKFILSCMMIAGHHLYITLIGGPVNNYEIYEQASRNYGNIVFPRTELLNEIYFFISGVLITCPKPSEKRNLNPFHAVIIRYFRFMPVFALLSLFYATVMYNISSGPLWNRIVGTETNKCKKNWWLNLLLLNNYIDQANLCLVTGWFLAVEFQFFLLSIPLKMLMNKLSKLRIKIFVAILFVSVLIPFTIAMYENIEPVMYLYPGVHETILKSKYLQKLYFPFHTRTTTYILGMAFGYVYCKMNNSKLEISAFKSILIIVTSVTVMLACTVGSAKYYDPYRTYSTLEAASFVAFNRFAYPMALGLLALIIGYGTLFPWITKFLSWSPFVPLSKLAFSANLVHMILQLINTASQRYPPTLRKGNLIFQFNEILIDIVLAQMLAFVLFICVENPISRLTKQLLNSGTNEKKE